MENFARNISRAVQQKDQSLSHFFQIGPPPRGNLLQIYFSGPPVARWQNGSQRQSVNRYTGCQSNGERTGQGSQCGIADCIGQVISPGSEGAPVHQIDDTTIASGFQEAGESLAE